MAALVLLLLAVGVFYTFFPHRIHVASGLGFNQPHSVHVLGGLLALSIAFILMRAQQTQQPFDDLTTFAIV